jgi:hypothetical protein
VGSAQLGNATDVGRLASQPPGELAEHPFDTDHRAGPKRQTHLLDIAEQRRGKPGWHRRPGGGASGGLVRMHLAGRDVDDAGVKQRGLGAEQRGGQRPHAVRVGAMAADGGDHLLASGVQIGLTQLVGSQAGQHRSLDHRRPLQHRGPRVEAELGSGRGERRVEPSVVADGYLTEIRAAEHEVVRAWPQPASDHQPADDPAMAQRGRAPLGQRQLRPARDAHPGQERTGRRGHRMVSKHASGEQIRAVGGNQLLHLRVAW